MAGTPLTDPLEIKNRKKVYATLKHNLSEREARWRQLPTQQVISIGTEEMGFIYEDLHHGRTTFAPHVVLAKPQGVRWDKGRELLEDNVVIMNVNDAKKHEEECLIEGKSVQEVWGEEKVAQVRRKHDEARNVMAYRRS